MSNLQPLLWYLLLHNKPPQHIHGARVSDQGQGSQGKARPLVSVGLLNRGQKTQFLAGTCPRGENWCWLVKELSWGENWGCLDSHPMAVWASPLRGG